MTPEEALAARRAERRAGYGLRTIIAQEKREEFDTTLSPGGIKAAAIEGARRIVDAMRRRRTSTVPRPQPSAPPAGPSSTSAPPGTGSIKRTGPKGSRPAPRAVPIKRLPRRVRDDPREEEDVSILADFGRGLKDIALERVRQRVLRPPSMPGSGAQQAGLFPVGPVIVGGGSRLPSILRGAGQVAAGTALGMGLQSALEEQPRRRRRMDYGNVKAAKRAIRRIKGTRKLLQDIERQLPRKTVQRRSRRDLGPGHTHVR